MQDITTQSTTESINEIDFSLIKLLPNGKVNARNLWQFFGSKKEFSNWIKNLIEDYDFEETKDFDKIIKPHENNKTDYELTINCAKEISMVSKTEQGKNARKYFIAMEQKAKTQLSSKDSLHLQLFSNDPLVIATAHKALVQLETAPLLEKIEEDKPMVEFASTIVVAQNSITMGEFSKLLPSEWNLGEVLLFKLLRSKNILCCERSNWNNPLQQYISSGYFEVQEKSYISPVNNKPTIYLITKISGKGQVWLIKKLKDYGYGN